MNRTKKAKKDRSMWKMSDEQLQSHMSHKGAGFHASAPNRQRSRGDAKRAALREQY